MPLRYLFTDMNAYFASVEQQHRPELRGKPVAVAPVLAESTCCIAASYEAKPFGVKTGTPVYEARRLCPGLIVVEARPDLYVRVQKKIVAAVESCLPVMPFPSIDEMYCRLKGPDQDPDTAVGLARQVKAAVAKAAGPFVRCSVGIAPNGLLAKVASDMQKPDGLTVIRSEELPGRLYGLQLIDFPGIGPRMERRLHLCGIRTVEQLCGLSVDRLSAIWGSKVFGQRWWHRLRGEDVVDPPSRRRSLGHSHVLPPELRSYDGARAVLMRLVHKAAARLRQVDYWAGSVTIAVSTEEGTRWHVGRRLPQCRDTLTLVREVGKLWAGRPRGTPKKLGVVFGELVEDKQATPSLFEDDHRLEALGKAMDRVNQSFGPFAVYFGVMFGMQKAAPPRIAFGRVLAETEMAEFDVEETAEGLAALAV